MPRNQQIPADGRGDIWLENADVIRDLYLNRQPRLSLAQVREIMMKDHGFPDFRLSIWEARLRDKLGLRKKLKKNEWPIVWKHCVQREREGKPSAVYLQGALIPPKRAWAEMRRQNARTGGHHGTEPLPALPAGVEVRNPPHGTPSVLNRRVPTCPVSQRPKAIVTKNWRLVDKIEDALRVSVSTSFNTALDSVAFELRVCLGFLPWNVWIKSFRDTLSASKPNKNTTEVQGSPLTFMEYVERTVEFGTVATNTPLATLGSYHHHSNSNHQLGSYFDTYYLLAQWLYLFSNRHMGHEGDPGQLSITRRFLEELLPRVPQRAFSAILNTGLPSVHASWEALMDALDMIHTAKELSYVVESGLNRPEWIFPYRNVLLIHAARIGCSALIKRLLSAGASAQWASIIYCGRMTALSAAAKYPHGSCFRLLLEHCEINKPCYTSEPDEEEEFGCDLCVDLAPFSIFYHFVMSCSAYEASDDFNREMIGLLLEAGADVDAPAPCTYLDFASTSAFCNTEPLPAELHTTIVEKVFYTRPWDFYQLLPFSRTPHRQISQARLLEAAVNGSGALEAYLSTVTTDASEVKRQLEFCLAKACFLVLNSESEIPRRFQVICSVLSLNVGPALPSIYGFCNVQKMFNTMISWAEWVIEELDGTSSQNFIEIIQQLLRQGALWDEVDWTDFIRRDSLSIFPILSCLGAEFMSLDGRVLSAAAHAGNLSAVRWLLNAGVDVNATWPTDNSRGSSTVLLTAIERPLKFEILQLLLKRGAMLPEDLQGQSLVRLLRRALETQLKDAHFYGCGRSFDLGMIKFILSLGPDLKGSPLSNLDLLEACFVFYPLVAADTNHHLTIFNLLLEQGAPVTSATLATLISIGGESCQIEQLINRGSDIHGYAVERKMRDVHAEGPCAGIIRGLSPIQAAVIQRDKKLVGFLLENGADINQPAFNKGGLTALQAACQMEERPWEHGTRLSMVNFLLGLGADANGQPANVHGFTALQSVAAHGDLEIAILLLDRGADPNIRDAEETSDGRTALDFAAENGRLDMIQLLLSVGGCSGTPGETGVDGAIRVARSFAIEKYLKAYSESASTLSSD